MKLRLTASMALCALLVLASGAFAKNTGEGLGDGPAGHARGIVRMIEKLDLTPAQKHEVARILKDNLEESRALRDAVKTAMEQLHAIMDKTPGNADAVRAGAQTVAKAAVELAVQRGKVKAAIDAVLTPEQRARREVLREQHKEKFKARREERRHELEAWIEKNLS